MREFPLGDALGGVLKELVEKGEDGAAEFMVCRLSDATRRFFVALVFGIAFDWSSSTQNRDEKLRAKEAHRRKHSTHYLVCL